MLRNHRGPALVTSRYIRDRIQAVVLAYEGALVQPGEPDGQADAETAGQ
jgi:hypothetical protein